MTMLCKKKVLINIEATPNCFANCSMCPRHVISEKGFMEISTMDKIVNNAKESFCWELSLAGRGEPTLHPLFPKLVKAMGQSNIDTAVVTTGAVISAEHIEAIKKYVTRLRISVSSVEEEVFKKVHTGLDYNKIWENLRDIAKYLKEKTIIHLTGGVTIFDSVNQTIKALKKLGFEKIYLLPRFNRGGSLEPCLDKRKREELFEDNSILLSEKEYVHPINKFLARLEVLLKKTINKKYCMVGDSSININFKGEIYGCFQDFAQTSILGNLDSVNLLEFYQRKYLQVGKLGICKMCDANQVIHNSSL